MSTKKTTKNAAPAAAITNNSKGKVGGGSGPSPNNANPNNNKNCHIQTNARVKGTTAQFNRDKTTEPRPSRNDCREERLGVGSRPLINTTASAAVPSQDHNSNRGRSGGGGGGNGGGSGPPPSNSSRYPTDSSQGNNINRGPEQPTNINSNNNRNWRQMNSTKYNSKPWQNGPSQAKSTHFNNNNNQRDWRQNQSRNQASTPCGRSYHNNNSSNSSNNYRQSSNYHSNRNWQQDRHFQRRTNFRHNTISDDNCNIRTRISEPTNQNCYNDQRSNSKITWEKQKEIPKELDDKRINQKEDQEVKNKKPSESDQTLAKTRRKSLPDSSTKTTSSNESTDVNTAQSKNNDKALEKKPEENLSESSSKSKDKPDSHQTYPKIQVRPLTELLEQNRTGTTKEDRLAENSPPTPTKLPIRPALKISRRSTISHCRDNVVSFNDRLARMDKESLKYIINNSNTIFEEQLQKQARQRICEQISRRLKGIEFEKPKNNPVNQVIEDEIVDATKLPALFLQEIENCFGLEIFTTQKNLQDHQEKETNQTNESIVQPEKHTEENNEREFVESSKVNKENTKDLITPATALSTEASKEKNESERSIVESTKVSKETPKESITADKAVNIKPYEFSQNSEISVQKDNERDQVVLAKKSTKNRENVLQKDKDKDQVVPGKEATENTENAHKIDNEKDEVVLTKKTTGNTEKALQKAIEKDQAALAKEVELPKVKRKSSGEDELDEQPIKKPKETNKGNESVKENSEKETESKDMAKQHSSDLMARLKVAEEFNERLNCNTLLNNGNKQDKKSPQKDKSPEIELAGSPVLDSLEVEIKDEPVFVCSTSPMPTVVISSSDDEDYAENDDDDDDSDEEDGVENEDVKTDSDSNSCSSFSKSHYNEQLQSGVVIDTFEKLILPQLSQQLVERYRKNDSATLFTRLQFIFGVVTSSKHNPQVFSNTEISKIQKNLKETNNRIAIEFLLKEIVNVAASQRGKEEQNGANGITVAKNAESAEVIHQRNQVDVSPTPPPPVSQNAPLSMQCLRQQPFNLPSIQLGLESSMPRLQLGSCYSLLANGETKTESSYGQDSITQSLLEIDRRLLEYQNRRSFIDEIIMKFQKEKSDLEMLTLELHNRKFLILNSVVTKNPAGGTPSQAAPIPTVTPTNSPSPDLESIATELSLPPTPPVASKPSKEVNRRKKSKRNARRKLRSGNEQQESESISIPKPIHRIKEDPDNGEISLAANSHPPVKKLRITKSNLSQQQQPLAIIPPLPPPPPPPEPIVNSMSIVPPLLPPPTLPDSIANISYSHPNRGESNSDFDCIPSGRLHSISYPITHIRIYKIYIIASSEDGDIYMFNIKNHKLERQITKHSEAITNMYLCKKESYLYTTSLDGFLKKSSLENLERVMQTVYFKEPLQSIDLAWDLAFIGSRWGNLFTFDVMTNKVMESPLLSTGQSIIAVKATKEGPRKIVILGCKGNFVYMHDATTGLLLRRLTLPNDLNVYSLLLNDGHVYCGTQKNEIYKFDFASGNLVDKVSCGNGAVSMVAYGEQYLLVGCYDGYIYVLDKLGCNRMGRFEGAGRMVLALAIAGDKVVTSSKDKSLVVLDIPQQMINTEH